MLAIAAAALGAAQGLMSHQAAVDQADAHNAATMQTHENARRSTQFKYEAADTNFINAIDDANNLGYDAALETAAAKATAQAMATSVSGSSVSAVVAALAQKGARNANKVQDKRDDAFLDRFITDKAAEAEGNSIIASNPFIEGPSALEGMLSVAMGAAKGYFMATGAGAEGIGSLFDTGGTKAAALAPNAMADVSSFTPAYKTYNPSLSIG